MPDRPLSATVRSTLAEGAKPRPLVASALPETATVDELALAATSGDTEAVGRLYDALVAPIHRYVGLRIRRREDAEDVTHLVFERIVAGLPKYRHNGKPFTAWAFRIARNAVIDHKRRVRPTERLSAVAEPSAGNGLDDVTVRGEEVRELRAAMRRLTTDQREALALRYAAGLSAEEAARVMGRRAGTIRGLTFRAIGALRRQLEEPASP
jgi:RNA polymerase sigma-70 factor, ECF subfamily